MFKVGDIVRGLKNEEYGITNDEMLKAKILNVYEDVKKVNVEIYKSFVKDVIKIRAISINFELLNDL